MTNTENYAHISGMAKQTNYTYKYKILIDKYIIHEVRAILKQALNMSVHFIYYIMDPSINRIYKGIPIYISTY